MVLIVYGDGGGGGGGGGNIRGLKFCLVSLGVRRGSPDHCILIVEEFYFARLR